jgi:hypothetical protein
MSTIYLTAGQRAAGSKKLNRKRPEPLFSLIGSRHKAIEKGVRLPNV